MSVIDETEESPSWLDESTELPSVNTSDSYGSSGKRFGAAVAKNKLSRLNKNISKTMRRRHSSDESSVTNLNSYNSQSGMEMQNTNYVTRRFLERDNSTSREEIPQCVGTKNLPVNSNTSESLSSADSNTQHDYSLGSAALSSAKSIGRYVAKSIARESSLPPKKRGKFHCLHSTQKNDQNDENKNDAAMEKQIKFQSNRIANLENTLELVYKKMKLHEDNIDELQEKLYLVEFGTPGTFLASCRFYIALFKCTAIPIIIVEEFHVKDFF
ncbi:uncharacterized protein LOC144427329 [Styela clava]